MGKKNPKFKKAEHNSRGACLENSVISDNKKIGKKEKIDE